MDIRDPDAQLPPSGRLSESQIRITLLPSNEGPMAPIAKTPVFQAMKVAGAFEQDPNFVSGYRGFVEVEAESIAVSGPSDLSKADREKILRTLRTRVLESARFPVIRFDLLGIRAEPAPKAEQPVPAEQANSGWGLDGRLSLHGQVKDLSVTMWRKARDLYEGEFSIRQTDFGITPASAFLGALRSKDRVNVRITIDFRGKDSGA